MDEAIKASAIVEHASRCDGQMHPNVIANEPDFRLRKIKEVWFVGDNVWVHLAIANEPDFRLRKIKEALYIRHNVVINRDKGTEVSDTWTNLIMRNRLCSTTTTTTD
ncbi:hypothetical protein M513_03076 [Trichuris suis]|uniref:Uncharacterized protein n=1 Tax=Trichuris suis TaxID=68888 RepID=A0A085MFF6_9BILA|nr:hypothetical protein M513_03076 [Trichuris suis]